DISLQFSLFCFAICPFIIIIHSVNPPPRIWSYLSFPLILLIGHSFSLLKIKKHITPLIFTFFYSVVLIHFSYNEINTREKLSFDSYKLFNLIKEKKYNSAFIYHPLIKTNLSYYFEKEDLPKFTFTHQDLISTDSLNRVKNYDIIISSVELLSDKDYILKEIFEEDLFLYKKREN
ncbi:MAG: hypothetical protein ACPG5P_01960, partial [Saprospiraceae bacterium]